MTLQPLFNTRYEEVVPITTFVETSYLADFTAFKTYSDTHFGTAFKTSLATNLAAAAAITSSSFYIKEIKLLNIKITLNIGALRPNLDLLEVYVEFAEADLLCTVADFGISKVRKQIHKKNYEGLTQALDDLNHNINDPTNLAALTAHDFTPALHTAITDLTTTIKQQLIDRNILIDKKEAAVQANLILFNTLWEQVLLLLKTGKRLFKHSDPEKTREYTLTVLKSRVRRASHKAIADDTGGAQADEYVLAVPINNFAVADFQIQPNSHYLATVTGDTALTGFLSKTPDLTSRDTADKFIIEPGDDHLIDTTPYPLCKYIIIINPDTEQPGEITITLVE